MALVIEDGSGKVDSTSYATVEELRLYATERGATLPTDAECEVLLIQAMDYLHDQVYQGDRRSKEQALDWPRTGAQVEYWPIAPDEIPRQLIQAQCALAIEAQTVDLLPTHAADAPGAVVSESVGPVSVAYANTGSVRRVPAMAKADALLATLLKRSGLTAIRV